MVSIAMIATGHATRRESTPEHSCYACAMRAIVCLLALAGAAADARADAPDQQVLALLNRYRTLAGLRAVKLDSTLSKGCMEHAEYMRLNHGTAAMQGLNPHTQDPKLPGATPAGAACGKAADLFAGVADLG